MSTALLRLFVCTRWAVIVLQVCDCHEFQVTLPWIRIHTMRTFCYILIQ